MIPVHDELKTALEALKAAWPERVGPARPVVASERGRFGANGVAHWFKRIYQDAGLTGASSHSGRWTNSEMWWNLNPAALFSASWSLGSAGS